MRLGTFLILGIAAVSQAQPGASDEPDFERVRKDYDYGKYAEVLAYVRERMQYGNLNEDQVIELHKYAGLSAFNLNNREASERHFTALLRLNPDFELDPFVVPPPAIAFFQDVRRRLSKELEGLRQVRQAKIERQRLEADRREMERRNSEERRSLDELSSRVARRSGKPSFLINFIPFGAGQFDQGRNGLGVFLAVAQAAAAATSIIAFLTYDSLRSTQPLVIDSVITPTGRFTVLEQGIPRQRVREANSWRVIKYASGGLFYSLYAYGVIDALVRHDDGAAPARTPKPPKASSKPRPWEDTQPFVFTTSGGAGAGVRLRF